MKFVLGPLLILTLFAVAPVAEGQSCRRLFVQSAEHFKTSILEKEIIKEIEEGKVRLARERAKKAHMRNVSIMIFERLTEFFQYPNGHKYPLFQLRTGHPHRARLLAKIGSQGANDLLVEANRWITRYLDYGKSTDSYIERSVLIRAEYRAMREALNSKAFPMIVTLPRFFREGKVLYEEVTFKNREDLERNIDRLRKDEGDRFDSPWRWSYSRFDYLWGREYEQASLLSQLRILHSELKKFPTDPRKGEYFPEREDLVKLLEDIIYDPTLRPSVSAMFDYAKSVFREEIKFFQGFGAPASASASDMLKRLRENDMYDMGLDGRRVGFYRQVFRILVLTIPLQVAGWTTATYGPDVKYELVRRALENTVKVEIVVSPNEGEFTGRLEKFITSKYRVDLRQGPKVLTPEAQQEIQKIREARQLFLENQKNIQDALQLVPAPVEAKSEIKLRELVTIVRAESKDSFVQAAQNYFESKVAKSFSQVERAELETFLTTTSVQVAENSLKALQVTLGDINLSDLQQIRELRGRYQDDLAKSGNPEASLLQVLLDFSEH